LKGETSPAAVVSVRKAGKKRPIPGKKKKKSAGAYLEKSPSPSTRGPLQSRLERGLKPASHGSGSGSLLIKPTSLVGGGSASTLEHEHLLGLRSSGIRVSICDLYIGDLYNTRTLIYVLRVERSPVKKLSSPSTWKVYRSRHDFRRLSEALRAAKFIIKSLPSSTLAAHAAGEGQESDPRVLLDAERSSLSSLGRWLKSMLKLEKIEAGDDGPRVVTPLELAFVRTFLARSADQPPEPLDVALSDRSDTCLARMREAEEKIEDSGAPAPQMSPERTPQMTVPCPCRSPSPLTLAPTKYSALPPEVPTQNGCAKDFLGAGDFTVGMLEWVRGLGKGSHGTVVLARHKKNDQLYAVKVLNKKTVVRRKQLEHTLAELRVNAMIASDYAEGTCPYIVPLKFAFQTPRDLYMAFEYCSGGELYFHIGKRGKLPEALARFYCAEIILALGYLHSRGICYHDLKPENLMLDKDGHICLVDFGLCQLDVHSPTKGAKGHCGTAEYLAPEILRLEEHGTSVDIWALGMVMYEMVTGLPPWYSYDQDEMVQSIMSSRLSFPGHVSRLCRRLIKKMLDRDPTQRLCSTGGVAEAIKEPFFSHVAWDELAQRRIEAPFVPPTAEGTDVCNFDPQFSDMKLPVSDDMKDVDPVDGFGDFFFSVGANEI